VKPERPIDSASAQSSWPGVTGEPGDLFTPRNPHTTPSRSHPSATPLPSRAHEAVQAGLAETPANQSAPPPRRWPFPLPPSLVTGGCAVLAISGAAVSVLLITAHYHRTSTATPPLVTQSPDRRRHPWLRHPPPRWSPECPQTLPYRVAHRPKRPTPRSRWPPPHPRAHRRPSIPRPVIRSASTPPRRHWPPRHHHPPRRTPRHHRHRGLRINRRGGSGTRPPPATRRGTASTITTPNPPPPATVRHRRQCRTPPEVLSPQPAGNTHPGMRPTTPPPPGHDCAPPTQSTTAITTNRVVSASAAHRCRRPTPVAAPNRRRHRPRWRREAPRL
jgi:hypothetical protein